MRTEELHVNDEVVYTPLKVLGEKLKVAEIAPGVNLVRLTNGKDFNIWVHASELSRKVA